MLTLDRIITRGEFNPKGLGPSHWLPGGGGLTFLRPSKELKGGVDVVLLDPGSGKIRVLVPARLLVLPGGKRPLRPADFSWSPSGKKMLVFTRARRVWRYHTKGDYYVLDLETRKLRKLGKGMPPSSLMFAKFSPDGKRAAYVHGNDLYVEDLERGGVTRLTGDGSADVSNGTSDWVYEEEFGLRDGYRWSPDGLWIAYWRIDTTGVGTFYLVNNTAGNYQKLKAFKYPKVGTTNPSCRIGIVSSSGGETKWIGFEGSDRDHYIPRMDWAGPGEIVLQRMDRRQQEDRLFLVDRSTGKVRQVLVERDSCWVDFQDSPRFLSGGTKFLWLSERDGRRRLYLASVKDGSLVNLTPGEFDVVSQAGVDERDGWVYFIASPKDASRRFLYKAPLKGGGPCERVTPPSFERGTHAYRISPEGKWALHTWSSFGVPPRTELVRLPGHETAWRMDPDRGLEERLGRLRRGKVEFFKIDIGVGVLLDAWCMKPPGFDPSRRYPVLFYVYGEPAGQTVRDAWGGTYYLWHLMLTQKGYVVMSVDNRGTKAPKGRAWRKCVYRKVGILPPEDQAAAVRRILATRPWVDPGRIGIWGWSGGGSMSLDAIFRHPEIYRMAMAIAFVADQRDYDTVYQERYMGLLQDNPEGYRLGSPVTWAHQLRGDLLLVSGTGDDNVHYQNMEVLVNRLIETGRSFTMTAYPNRSHGIYEGRGTRRHLFGLLTRFLEEHLPAGPR